VSGGSADGRASIARIWRGCTTADKADTHADYLREDGIRPLAATALGVQMLRADGPKRSELVTISWWESVEAMARFAGKNPRRIHHLPRDPEFLVPLPRSVRIMQFVFAAGCCGP
jgi:hypothetical protein